ncbi:hypothetical protein BpHYR1_039420 [Brachionus plicatilis]|uniref:Uncharacterized protein n=1 Tax=Brachionus plicatilis TaxID=10195 RepID=A0A3M7R0I9_BRAPC|nr:hypothetical protein BpHYR1_039420 [Brachionus plicatilis]
MPPNKESTQSTQFNRYFVESLKILQSINKYYLIRKFFCITIKKTIEPISWVWLSNYATKLNANSAKCNLCTPPITLNIYNSSTTEISLTNSKILYRLFLILSYYYLMDSLLRSKTFDHNFLTEHCTDIVYISLLEDILRV